MRPRRDPLNTGDLPKPRSAATAPELTPFERRSLRDEIALQAMMRVLTPDNFGALNMSCLARHCYALADAMIDARAQPPAQREDAA